MNEITASAETLERQAAGAAGYYLTRAVYEIDAAFGEGFAKKNPALVASFMRTAATEYATGANCKYIGSAIESIGEALQGIDDALDNVSDAIAKRIKS